MNHQSGLFRIFGLILSAAAVFSLPGAAASQTVTTLSLDPAAAVAATCAETQIVVRVEDVENLWAYHVQFTFDPAVIQVTSMENGPFLQKGIFLTNDDTPGMFYIANAQIAGDGVEPVTGSGDLAVFKVRALTPDSSTPLSFNTTETALSNRDGFPIPYGAVGGVVNTVGCGEAFIYLPLVLRQ